MKVRKVAFDLQKKLVRHYFKGNVFSTHLANSLHIIFPEGEKFFIRSCRQFLDKIDDKQLKKDVIDFMGQEGTHSKAHLDFWQYLEQQGFNVSRFANFMDQTAFQGIEKFIYASMGKQKGAEFCLAMTAGFEHYTALLAEVAFENENEFKHLPGEMQHLWFWHAAEEIEHKSVAFDLLKYINDDALLKNSGFATATSLLFFYTLLGQIYFVVSDEENSIWDMPVEFYEYVDDLAGPMTKKFLGNMSDYFKPDFHPSQMDNDQLAVNFFAKHDRYQTSKKSKPKNSIREKA